jgi:enoyl-CoA hydratase/carnithine racemase
MDMSVKHMIRYEVRDHIAEIRIDHPPVNGLNLDLIDRLIAALHRAAADDEARAVLITSAVPRRFCAGLDLTPLLNDDSGADIHRVVDKLYVGLSDAQSALGKPSIAVVNGAARGGGMTLAISCDVLIAGQSASFGYPEIDVGLIPAIHFVQLPRIVGRHRAFELLFSGRSFGAAEAAALGLVSKVVDDESLNSEARALAATFAAKSPSVMRLGRAAFLRANESGIRPKLEQAVRDICEIAAIDDGREGLRAFAEKRKPEWTTR